MYFDQFTAVTQVGYHESGVKADVFSKLHLTSAQIKHFTSLFRF